MDTVQPSPASVRSPTVLPGFTTSRSDLWYLLNQPHAFDRRSVRIGCTVLLTVYAVIWLVRPHAPNPVVVPERAAICAYALLGVIVAPWLTWRTLRLFTAGLGLVLPLGNSFMNGMLGNDVPALLFTALATAGGMMFLQTGWDFLLVWGAVSLGNVLLLPLLPPSTIPPVTLVLVLWTAAGAGVAAGIVMQTYRVLLEESRRWWEEACARERVLREFAEVTAAATNDPRLLDTLAERFRVITGAGRCVILAGDTAGGPMRIVGSGGFPPEHERALTAEPLSAPLTQTLWAMVADRHPVVYEHLGAGQRSEIDAQLTVPFVSHFMAVLPLTVGDVVSGAVILTAPTPRVLPPEERALWQAMANQAGVAIANARLITQLRAALQAKSEFLNTMSHELRSPLHVIVGYADMLRELLLETQSEFLGTRIRTSALELLQLVENTMNAARLDAGKVTLHVEQFAIADVVRELSDGVRVLPEAKNAVPVRWDVDPTLPPVRLDRLKLKEIIQNLVSNALKFTREGEVTVGIALDGIELRIAVCDTGPGIPPEAQARIFEMFERVEPTHGHRPAGVGLGLYIVKSLVQLMEGRIVVESAVGRGTRFDVRLPAALTTLAA
ncbi:MAG: GAF domain-containing sensor histidine kinase [Candidatus Binatia bacterium]